MSVPKIVGVPLSGETANPDLKPGKIVWGVDQRWSPALAKKFCPVSSIFLEHYHELAPVPGGRGMTSTEAMLIIQILDYKWDSRAPFPTVKTLAKRMGLSARMIRTALKNLEDGQYIRREPFPNGGPNRYHFEGLFTALEKFVQVQALEAA